MKFKFNKNLFTSAIATLLIFGSTIPMTLFDDLSHQEILEMKSELAQLNEKTKSGGLEPFTIPDYRYEIDSTWDDAWFNSRTDYVVNVGKESDPSKMAISVKFDPRNPYFKTSNFSQILSNYLEYPSNFDLLDRYAASFNMYRNDLTTWNHSYELPLVAWDDGTFEGVFIGADNIAENLVNNKTMSNNAEFQTFSFTALGSQNFQGPRFDEIPDEFRRSIALKDDDSGMKVTTILSIAYDEPLFNVKLYGTEKYSKHYSRTLVSNVTGANSHYKGMTLNEDFESIVNAFTSQDKTVEEFMDEFQHYRDAHIIVTGDGVPLSFSRFFDGKITPNPFDGTIDIDLKINGGYKIIEDKYYSETQNVFEDWKTLNPDGVSFKKTISGFKKVAETKISAKATYDKTLLSTDLAKYISSGGVGGTVDMAKLEEYADLSGLPDVANNRIWIEKSETVQNDANVTLTIGINYYYDDSGSLRSNSKFFELNYSMTAARKQTEIVYRDDIDKEKTAQETRDYLKHQIIDDKVQPYLLNERLNEYIDLSYFPENAKFVMTNMLIGKEVGTDGITEVTFFSFTLTTNLIINEFGLDEFTETTYDIKISDLKLLPESIPVLSEELDYNITAWEYLRILQHSAVSNIDLQILQKVLNIDSFPESASFKVINLKAAKYIDQETSETLSKLEFTLRTTAYVDDVGVINQSQKEFKIEVLKLRLPIDSKPVLLETYDNNRSVIEFVETLSSYEDESEELRAELFSYFNFDTFPSIAKYSVLDFDTRGSVAPFGKVKFKIKASHYYNEYEELIEFNNFKPKYFDVEIDDFFILSSVPTSVEYKNYDPTTKVSELEYLLRENSTDPKAIMQYLSTIIEFRSFPPNKEGEYDLTINTSSISLEKSVLKFNITTNFWFDEDGTIQTTAKDFEYEVIGYASAESIAVSKSGAYKETLDSQTFLNHIGGLNKTANSNLFNYIDKTWFPTMAKFNIVGVENIINTKETRGLTLKLIPDLIFKNQGDTAFVQPNSEVFEFEIVFAKQDKMSTIILWASIGGGVGLLFLIFGVIYIRMWTKKKRD
ncbi:MAG: hypothetical protein ACRC4M_00175 [Mycoplasma sp.]